jgi:hypothetical protein
MVAHEDYGDTIEGNDIALLHLKTPLNLNECVNPVCLPQFNDAHPWGHKVITSGWYPSF